MYFLQPAGKCGSCGAVAEPPKCGKPKVANKECPMMRPRCPNDKKEEQGFFAKISAFFSGKVSIF